MTPRLALYSTRRNRSIRRRSSIPSTRSLPTAVWRLCRLKRMIKSSGMNVYPSQVEEVLYRHPDVLEACVIGVPDEAQVERVKAFVVLKDPARAGPEVEAQLLEHCRGELIKWSCPREVEFRPELPKTLIGKVAFRELEEEERAKVTPKPRSST